LKENKSAQVSLSKNTKLHIFLNRKKTKLENKIGQVFSLKNNIAHFLIERKQNCSSSSG
jgi:hypothetical protein